MLFLLTCGFASAAFPRRFAKEASTPAVKFRYTWHSLRGAVARGWSCSPLRNRARHAFSRIGSWSINGDTASGCCSFDLLYGGSDADEIERGRPEFHIEVTFVGFVVGGDHIRFVDGEDV